MSVAFEILWVASFDDGAGLGQGVTGLAPGECGC